ncbi:MAG TPA: OsmC family protein [Chloroflexota bacterium]|nr:OsmC family protein [Chloroflexota bacterium]
MQLHILAHQHIRLKTAGDGLEVIGESFGPLEMLATSLALCTASVVSTYAETAHLDLTGLEVEVRWEYVDQPYRVGAYTMTLHLPATVPEARRRPIMRAAETCTVHNTLVHPPRITTEVRSLEGQPVTG